MSQSWSEPEHHVGTGAFTIPRWRLAEGLEVGRWLKNSWWEERKVLHSAWYWNERWMKIRMSPLIGNLRLAGGKESLGNEDSCHLTLEPLYVGGSCNVQCVSCLGKKTHCLSQFGICYFSSWTVIFFVVRFSSWRGMPPLPHRTMADRSRAGRTHGVELLLSSHPDVVGIGYDMIEHGLHRIKISPVLGLGFSAKRSSWHHECWTVWDILKLDNTSWSRRLSMCKVQWPPLLTRLKPPWNIWYFQQIEKNYCMLNRVIRLLDISRSRLR